MDCITPCFPVLHYLPEFVQTRVHWGNDAIQPSCHSLLLLPSVFPSIKFFSNESAHHIRWSKYWSFTFSISPSSEYSGLVSFRINWFDLLVVQGTLKSLLQHDSLKASILSCSAFFMVQVSHPYMTIITLISVPICAVSPFSHIHLYSKLKPYIDFHTQKRHSCKASSGFGNFPRSSNGNMERAHGAL